MLHNIHRKKWHQTLQTGLMMIGLLMTPLWAHAANVKVGILTCHEASGWGFIVESTRDLKCTYSPTSGPSEYYMGHISKFGIDIGYKGASVIIWNVIAPEFKASSGALAGDYVGATGGASVGVGLGANVLVGGSNKSFTLQPVSFEGDTGLNVAVGVGALNLQQYQPNASQP